MITQTPKQIVRELNKFIVGQKNAKRAVAIALRNRWRRQQVPNSMKDEIVPNNIILIGSTGVGKTEIARRLANLANAPFLKVEASKFTEVGYVGRDVESIIRDLMNTSVNMVRLEQEKKVIGQAIELTKKRLVDLLFPAGSVAAERRKSEEAEKRYQRNRTKLLKKLENGDFENRYVELDIPEENLPMMQVFGPIGLEDMGSNIKDMLSNVLPTNKKHRRMKVSKARDVIIEMETQNLLDRDEIIRIAKDRIENNGIVFLDEIDKICGNERSAGPDVSREGVQRDLLPIIEGSTVSTKYGSVKSDHVLFIAAGAFHVSTPSDMIPELQGRFPIRVEMDKLTTKDFVKILTHPKSALIKQYQALLEAEGVTLSFQKSAIKAIAEIATEVNTKTENIGARRLHTIMTTLLDEYMYEKVKGRTPNGALEITPKIVKEKLSDIAEDQDLSRYIL
ncbi:MAG: ATP-dependent protease ATPase subunit HslU [Candidatus Marinimicrobia bacterium]|nr:ATP-dependent protease ATPase subunit HslU [Candidatus Neomarinimicrobiota bacterium]